MVVLLFTSVLTHAANVFELIPCVKPSVSEFQINVCAQNNESRDLKAYFGRIMKKNHKGRTLAAFAKYIMSFLKIKVET